ncbi:nuclear transport factor 2 family protein [Streptomyces sviceus]|uniref:nuclear transport factor 2 family protein n=1 Tax=Streptomyces sviceus TaxID=285530 RepID=UPI0036C8A98D
MRQYLRAFETSDTAALGELLRSDMEYENPVPRRRERPALAQGPARESLRWRFLEAIV